MSEHSLQDQFFLDANDVESTKRDTTFDIRGSNPEFLSPNDRASNALANQVYASVKGLVVTAGTDRGYSPEAMKSFFDSLWGPGGGSDYFTSVVNSVTAAGDRRHRGNLAEQDFFLGVNDASGQVAPVEKGIEPVYTVEGFKFLVQKTWDWFGNNSTFDLGEFPGLTSVSRGSGSGSRGPTAQDIRNNYDLDQLAERAQDIWRGMLLEDTPNARSLANSYVDKMVASGGEKQLNFDEYIRGFAKATPRAASIYTNKPAALSEEQYIQPYLAAAQRVMRPGNAADTAISGAQFGSSADTFAGSLRRQDEATGSSGFINELEGRMQGLSGVLKG